MLSNANNTAMCYDKLIKNFEEDGGEREQGVQKWFLELPWATPGS